jgi:anti-sigma regulatory factor (Ser/Thr protein kinase)
MGTEPIVSFRWNWHVGQARTQTIADSRHAFARVLREHGINDAHVESAVMILGELLANACEHGRVPVEVSLASRKGELELRVVDSGTGVTRPSGARDPESLRGRGFEIIERLGGRIALQGRPRSSVRVVLPFHLAQ